MSENSFNLIRTVYILVPYTISLDSLSLSRIRYIRLYEPPSKKDRLGCTNIIITTKKKILNY